MSFAPTRPPVQDSAVASVSPRAARSAPDDLLHRLVAGPVDEGAEPLADGVAHLGEARLGLLRRRAARDGAEVVVRERGAEAERRRRPRAPRRAAPGRGSTRRARRCAAAPRASRAAGGRRRRAARRSAAAPARPSSSSARGARPGRQKKSAGPAAPSRGGHLEHAARRGADGVLEHLGAGRAASACLALISAISRPTRAKNARIAASDGSCSTSSRPKVRASTSTVRSSRVGPRPPETSTTLRAPARAQEGVAHVGRVVAHRASGSASRPRAGAAARRGTPCSSRRSRRAGSRRRW